MWLRANLNFGSYRRNNVYLVPDANYDEGQALALVGAGYFTEVGDGADNSVEPIPATDPDVAVSVRPKRKRKVADGPGEDLPDREDPDSAGGGSTVGGADNQPD